MVVVETTGWSIEVAAVADYSQLLLLPLRLLWPRRLTFAFVASLPLLPLLLPLESFQNELKHQVKIYLKLIFRFYFNLKSLFLIN